MTAYEMDRLANLVIVNHGKAFTDLELLLMANEGGSNTKLSKVITEKQLQAGSLR